jgi:poly(3-hydroxybutyrate) depolymerase
MGTVGIGGSAGVGAAADVVIVDKTTTAKLADEASLHAAGNVRIDADSSETLRSIVVGLGGGADVGVAGSVAAIKIDATTEAVIGRKATAFTRGSMAVDAASDTTVVTMNQRELMEQWTSAHGIDQTGDATSMVDGATRTEYKDAQGRTRVETITIPSFGHGTPVKPAEMCEGLRSAGLETTDLTGVTYNPLLDTWRLARDMDVNYMGFAIKGA